MLHDDAMTDDQQPATPFIWLTDSRQALTPEQAANAVFFAINGEHHDGHAFVGELYHKGVRQFVVERTALNPGRRSEFAAYRTGAPADAQFTEVDSSLHTLQAMAAQHRQQFQVPVVGVTGSNGKTIVKEWLAQLLSSGPPPHEFIIAKSPRSYNSQLGVPLSVHELNDTHTLGIFEAGTSKPGEMAALETIIRPTLGIFTNIGTAHDEGFRSRKQKIAEKLRLFIRAETLIYCADYVDINEEVHLLLCAVNPGLRLITWSLTGRATSGRNAHYQIERSGSSLRIKESQRSTGTETFDLPFTDAASVENLIHCLVAAKTLTTLDAPALQLRLNRLRPVSMRLELKEGVNNCVLIDDSYNNDVAGLQLALGFLNQQTTRHQTVVILSDVLQSGQREDELYRLVADLMRSSQVTQFVGIGPVVGQNARFFADNSQFYPDTDAFLARFSVAELRDAAVLVKGARAFSFERIVSRLQRKAHGTVLEINLDALTHNLNYYREKVGANVEIMVMVKAFAYGSGSAEVAQLLQFHRVDYLAVAYADEGVSLRQNGITLPVMVMNPAGETFALLLEHKLEPEIYSLQLLREWGRFLDQAVIDEARPAPPIHLKIDTGMHRLGFLESELPDVIAYLNEHPNLRVSTMFSHLVGADEAQFNAFSRQQYETFLRSSAALEAGLGYRPTRHLLNSAGIVRFSDYKLDMVRLGIGLYGVESSGIDTDAVQPVGTLKSTISQIKTVVAGDTVGYGRRGLLDHDARIATLAIGYADGYDRRLGNGAGQVWVNGTLCPTVGNVCMDMTMIDVTAASAAEGDEVIIFGPQLLITELARQMGTIPYEILTSVSERVKRVFFKD